MKKDSSSKEPPTLFIVEIDRDFGGMEKGSQIYVQRERETDYEGVWCDMDRSYYVTVPKGLCEKLKDN
jgi:hypothetical protein